MRPLSMALVATMMTAGAANAAGYSVFDEQALASTEISGSLSVAKFDTSLGTLNSVRWTVLSRVVGTIALTNQSGSAQNGSASSNVEFDLTSLNPMAWDLDLLDGFGTPNAVAYTVSAPTGPISLAAGASETFNVNGSTAFSNTVPGAFVPGNNNLSIWQGPGNIGFDYDTLTSLVLTFGGGNVLANQSTTAGIRLTVEYDYDAFPPPTNEVPLPAALPLFAAALGGLALLRRRKS